MVLSCESSVESLLETPDPILDEHLESNELISKFPFQARHTVLESRFERGQPLLDSPEALADLLVRSLEMRHPDF
jgi:hypothetical protein